MALSIQAIQFNHDPSSASADALNIRRNFTTPVTLPEWQNDVSVGYQDSPAAYAVAATAGNTITIQAQFQADDAFVPGMTIEISATDSGGNNPLGSVEATAVVLNASGGTGWVTMNVTGHPSSVSVSDVTWEWQWRTDAASPWQSFATTNHRIYVVLAVPNGPWTQNTSVPINTQLPWTEVLDHSCVWAAGATTLDGAAGLVTDSVYALGPGTITYDCPGGGSIHYVTQTNQFNCTAFLDRLAGGFGKGGYVDCVDCSTFVTVFSNILGCDLWSACMGMNFELNPVQGIGADGCGLVCGTTKVFTYHEVAWKGACGSDHGIFDACLRLNGSGTPTTCNGWIPVQPKDLPFEDYQAMVAAPTPAGRLKCNPIPTTAVQRAVF